MPDLKLPQEPTWKLLGCSPDMMDTQFCNKRFPFHWRSSLAISAFEPRPEDQPEVLCEGRITFLKITATIAGYQPSEGETKVGHASFPNVPTEDLSSIIDQYFACYGALLNVAVFPNPHDNKNLRDFPHIIDVEPKTRDLVQASSETGDILTSSKSNVKTNKSLTHTESSETGYELTASAGIPKKFSVGGKLSHKNTETEQENWSVNADAWRERQEKEGSNTQVSQLYNLLSSYHIGTNRVQFLMLARPHVLQPTDHRTFVNGLRQIEGVQEFLLIVARPPEVRGLCIEALLETGHFPEGLSVELPEDEFKKSHEEFKVTAFGETAFWNGDWKKIEATHNVESGWVVDTSPERGNDPGHPGMKEIANDSNDQANSSLKGYNYQRISDATVEVSGQVRGGGSTFGDEARFDRTYRVFTRSFKSTPSTSEAKVPIDRLLITSRSLCVCFKSGESCPELSSSGVGNLPMDSGIVAEPLIAISRRVLTGAANDDTRMPAMKELLSQIQNALTTNWRLPQRRPLEEATGFLESDYFIDKIRKFLPPDHLTKALANVPGLGRDVCARLGESCTVNEALEMNLAKFSEKTGLRIAEAAKARRKLLGIPATLGKE